MKLVEGRTLAALLADRLDPASELPRFLKIFAQVCQTVAYAHSRGVIHRDLKPRNIMVGAFGEVQVMDWGLAKVRGAAGGGQASPPVRPPVRTERSEQSDAHSRPGDVMGTPPYMAPEQARGEIDRLDERCDVFSLGAILWEILTGRPPYAGEAFAAVYRQAVQADLREVQARLGGCAADPALVRLARFLVPTLNQSDTQLMRSFRTWVREQAARGWQPSAT